MIRLVFVLLLLSLVPGAARAQSFSLGASRLQLAAFTDREARGAVAIRSEAANFAAAAVTVQSDKYWLSGSVSEDKQTLQIIVSPYIPATESQGTLTVRTSNKSVKLVVGVTKFFRSASPPMPPASVTMNRAASRLFMQYGDHLLALDARTSALLAATNLGAGLPAEANPTQSRLYLSADEAEVRVFNPGRQMLYRFDAATLAGKARLVIPETTTDHAPTYGRHFAADHAGSLYFIRYAERADGSIYDDFYASSVEVRSLADGALRQTLILPNPPGTVADRMEISAFDIHPSRPEVWVRTHHLVGYDKQTTRLLRLPLRSDGTVGETLSELVLATGTIPWTPSHLLPRVPAPSFLFTAARDIAVSGGYVIDDRPAVPVLLRTLEVTNMSYLAPDGGLAFGPFDNCNPRTGARINLPVPSWAASEACGFSFDGREVLIRFPYADPIPKLHFLPALVAASPDAQVRGPLADSFIPPTAQLSWFALPAVDHYRVYLAQRADELSPAVPSAALLLGETAEARLTLSAPLASARVYFWRVDAIIGERTVRGAVQSFTVSRARVGGLPLTGSTMAGARRGEMEIPISAEAGVAWSVVSDSPLLAIRDGAGVGPGTARLYIDATSLTSGFFPAAVRLVTADGALTLPVSLYVVASSFSSVLALPDSPIAYAIGPRHGQGRFLLSIDTTTERVDRCVATNLGDDTCLASRGALQPLFAGASDRITEFDPDTLALRRVIPGPENPFYLRSFYPTADGRFWLSNGNDLIGLFDPSSSAFTRLSPEGVTNWIAFDPQTATLMAARHEAGNGARSIELLAAPAFADHLGTVTRATLAVSPELKLKDYAPAASLHPLRLAYKGVVAGPDLSPLANLEDNIVGISCDASVVIGGRLLYSGENYDQRRVLPTSANPFETIYIPATRKLLTYRYDGLRFQSLDALPLAPDVTLGLVKVTDTSVRLSVSAALPYGSSPQRVLYRRAGSGDTWAPGSSWVNGLSPLTSYEFKARLEDWTDAALSAWSPVFTVTTALPGPRPAGPQPWPSSPRLLNFDESLTLGFPVTGDDLEWTVDGLPDGVAFDPATQTLSGRPQAGRHTIRLTATNAGGEITATLELLVRSPTVSAPTARYTGLLDLEGGPLTGSWSIERTGYAITGIYRSVLFTRSFKATIQAGAASDPDTYYRQGFTSIRYEGVPIHLGVNWDQIADTMTLRASTLDLVENYVANTTPETGLASHWASGTKPCPHAARYTALLLPGEGEGPLLPQGHGLLTLKLAEDGVASLVGETALGQKFTFASRASDRHSLPFFFYNGRDTVAFGGMEISAEESAGPRLTGGLAWGKNTDRKASGYRDGFEQELLVVGAPLPATGKALPPLDPLANAENRADFLLADGGLSRLSKPVTQTLVPAPAGFVAPKAGTKDNPNRVAVKLDSATGIVTGSAVLLDAAGKKTVRTVKFRGMLVRDPLGDGQDLVGGYFLFPDAKGLLQSGRFEITEPEPSE